MHFKTTCNNTILKLPQLKYCPPQSVCYWHEGFSKYEAQLTILLNLSTIFPYLKNRLQDFGEEGRTETMHDSVTVLGTAEIRAEKFLIINYTLDTLLEVA